MLETGGFALFHDQRADQATAEFFAAVHMGVIPVAAGVGHAELVVEVFAGQHRQLRDVGHAVHFQRQADAMPMDGGGDRQVVDETHPQPFALAHAQLGAGGRRAERPGLGLVPRHQFHIEGRGDQFVVVSRLGLGDFPQPVAVAATGTDAHYGQAGKTTQDLSTGKGSGHNNLTYLLRAEGLQRADTIHLRRLNSKTSHCRMPKTPKANVGGAVRRFDLLPIAVGQL